MNDFELIGVRHRIAMLLELLRIDVLGISCDTGGMSSHILAIDPGLSQCGREVRASQLRRISIFLEKIADDVEKEGKSQG